MSVWRGRHYESSTATRKGGTAPTQRGACSACAATFLKHCGQRQSSFSPAFVSGSL
jgi:hypothetical protein